MFKRNVVQVVTGSGGSAGVATAYSPIINGYVDSIRYLKTDFADGVDFTITTDYGQENLWVDTNINASERVRPRFPVTDTVGAAIAGAYDRCLLIKDRVKIVIAQGGDGKIGTFEIIVEEKP